MRGTDTSPVAGHFLARPLDSLSPPAQCLWRGPGSNITGPHSVTLAGFRVSNDVGPGLPDPMVGPVVGGNAAGPWSYGQ
jgi:hypothetical protein